MTRKPNWFSGPKPQIHLFFLHLCVPRLRVMQFSPFPVKLMGYGKSGSRCVE